MHPLTVKRSPSWMKDLLEPANRHSRERTNAAAAHARVNRDENRIGIDVAQIRVMIERFVAVGKWIWRQTARLLPL